MYISMLDTNMCWLPCPRLGTAMCLSNTAVDMKLEKFRVASNRAQLTRRNASQNSDSPPPPPEYKRWYVVGENGPPFLVHPEGLAGTIEFQWCRNDNLLVKGRQEPVEISAEAEPVPEPSQGATTSNEDQDKDDIAEEYLALTAKMLHGQLKESRAMCNHLSQAYYEDIDKVKSYASEETRRRIWSEKLQQGGHRHKKVTGSEDQFEYRCDELTATLCHLNKAVKGILKGWPWSNRPGYEARALQLNKLREAGGRVYQLAHQALASWDAFKELDTALSELQKQVNHVNKGKAKATHETCN
jgi:hypothetical protein